MSARQLFDEILAHSGHPDVPAYIRSMIGERYETQYLEFKSGSPKGIPLTDRDAIKIWSEALSGFANAGGGVLIFGIYAKEHKDGDQKVDRAFATSPVVHPAAFASRLRTIAVDAAAPPIAGVDVREFADATLGPDCGFVVCYVPDSEHKPHRAEIGGKRWVIRAGESFIDVQPAVLRSLFYPRVQSRLSIIGLFSWTDLKGPIDASCCVILVNEGPSTARNIVIRFVCPTDGIRRSIDTGWEPSVRGQPEVVELSAPLHPGQSRKFYMLDATYNGVAWHDTATTIIQWNPFKEQTFSVYAADREPEHLALIPDQETFAMQRRSEAIARPQKRERVTDFDYLLDPKE